MKQQRDKMEYKVFTIFIINLCIPTIQITYIRDFKIFPPRLQTDLAGITYAFNHSAT